jgi:hypothetical protein
MGRTTPGKQKDKNTHSRKQGGNANVESLLGNGENTLRWKMWHRIGTFFTTDVPHEAFHFGRFAPSLLESCGFVPREPSIGFLRTPLQPLGCPQGVVWRALRFALRNLDLRPGNAPQGVREAVPETPQESRPTGACNFVSAGPPRTRVAELVFATGARADPVAKQIFCFQNENIKKSICIYKSGELVFLDLGFWASNSNWPTGVPNVSV